MEEKNYIIYKINVNDCDFYYVGSTKNLNRRIFEHKKGFENNTNVDNNKPFYKKVRELNKKFEDFKFNILAYTDKENRFKIETSFINTEDINCLNDRVAFTGLNEKEYKKYHYETYKNKYIENSKKHYEKNKEEITSYKKQYYLKNIDKEKEKRKEYYDKNKDKVLNYQKEYKKNNLDKIKKRTEKTYVCECGKELTVYKKNRHETSKYHKDYITNNTTNNYNNCNITINNTTQPNK